MTRILAEKVLAVGLTVWLVATLSWSQVVLFYIVMGQGHFLTAYLYQYRAKKMNRRFLVLFFSSAALILLANSYWLSFNALACITTIYFLVHMLWDEMYLLRLPMELKSSPMCIGRALEMGPILLLYSARVTEGLFPQLRYKFQLLETARNWSLALCLLYLCLVALRRHRFDWKSGYFFLWGTLLLWGASAGWLGEIPTAKLTGFVIIYHYLVWYFHYFLTLDSTQKRLSFLTNISAVNGLVLALFWVFGQKGIGLFFFSERIFYIWTLLHLVTSTRLGDIKGLFRFRV